MDKEYSSFWVMGTNIRQQPNITEKYKSMKYNYSKNVMISKINVVVRNNNSRGVDK